jgi:hypothetical protein
MLTENSLGKLRPGAWKIVHALIKGPKSFSELRDATGLSHTGLAKYLKELAGLLAKDQKTRRYRLFWKPPSKEVGYSTWESTDLKDIHAAAKALDVILKAEFSPKEKTDLVANFLQASLEFMSGNIALNLSEAVKKKSIEDVLADVKSLMEEYVAPYISFLAMYCWAYGPETGGWLKLIGSSIAHNAKKEFDLGVIAELAKGVRADG